MKTNCLSFKNRQSPWNCPDFLGDSCRFKTRFFIALVFLLFVLLSGASFASSGTSNSGTTKSKGKQSERTKSFFRHKEKIRNWEEERERGYPEQLRLQEKREREMAEAAIKYRKKVNHKKINDPEDTPEYRKHIQKKINAYEEAEKKREEYAEKKKKDDSKVFDLDETIEYGLTEDRPRFPYKKRAIYGGKSLIKPSRPGSESSSPGFSYGGSLDYDNPPQNNPPIDDPPDDSGDYPMPDSGDEPPPPPPPPSPDEYGSEPVPPPPQEPPGDY